jgi:hypothetical protein
MSVQERSEIRGMTADEIDLVDGGLRFAAAFRCGVLALGVEIGDTRYIVNISECGVSAFTAPAS